MNQQYRSRMHQFLVSAFIPYEKLIKDARAGIHISTISHGLSMVPLYTFLKCCEKSRLKKEILDCGAGGEKPPLYIFHLLGYETRGIDISRDQLKRATVFCEEKGIDLSLEEGDIRDLPFKEESFSFVYSYDTIFHMPKKEVSTAMQEMKRVLKKEGLLYVNFVSTEHSGFGKGREVGIGEFIQNGPRGKVHISYYEDDEPDQYFGGFEILCKEKRIRQFTRSGALALGFDESVREHVHASLDYIARKNRACACGIRSLSLSKSS